MRAMSWALVFEFESSRLGQRFTFQRQFFPQCYYSIEDCLGVKRSGSCCMEQEIDTCIH